MEPAVRHGGDFLLLSIVAIHVGFAGALDPARPSEPARVTSSTPMFTKPDRLSEPAGPGLPAGAMIGVCRDAGMGWLEICAKAGGLTVCGFVPAKKTTWQGGAESGHDD